VEPGGTAMKGLTVVYAIWLREFKVFTREKFRIVGMIGQPLLYLLIVGKGITAGMRLNATGNIDYLKFIYPGIIGMSILFTSVFSALSIIWDREFGFLKEVLVAPVPRWGVAIGKSLGGATIVMMQTVVLICLAPVAGISLTVFVVAKLLVLSFVFAFALTSLGVVIASRMASMQSFQMVWNFMVLPLYFLSGAMFPMASAPGWMQALMAIDPMTYGVDAIRNVVFSGTMIRIGDEAAMPLLQVAKNAQLIRFSLTTDVAVMVATAAILSVLGAWSFSRSQAA
jgi:ABC-2 type transport system permease protein